MCDLQNLFSIININIRSNFFNLFTNLINMRVIQPNIRINKSNLSVIEHNARERFTNTHHIRCLTGNRFRDLLIHLITLSFKISKSFLGKSLAIILIPLSKLSIEGVLTGLLLSRNGAGFTDSPCKIKQAIFITLSLSILTVVLCLSSLEINFRVGQLLLITHHCRFR